METYDVYIIAGQSKAVGMSPIDTLDVSLREKTYPVKLFQAGDFSGGNERLTYKWLDEIACGMGGRPRYMGIEMGIAEQLTAVGRPSAVIRYAYGATDLAHCWKPLTFREPEPTRQDDESYHYNEWRKTVDFALSAFKDGRVRLRAIIWMHGEEDATDAWRAAEYRQNLTDLFAAMRSELNCPRLPVVVGEIGIGTSCGTYFDEVRAAQRMVCALDGHSVLVPADGLGERYDTRYWTGNDAYEMGCRLGKAALDM